MTCGAVKRYLRQSVTTDVVGPRRHLVGCLNCRQLVDQINQLDIEGELVRNLREVMSRQHFKGGRHLHRAGFRNLHRRAAALLAQGKS